MNNEERAALHAQIETLKDAARMPWACPMPLEHMDKLLAQTPDQALQEDRARYAELGYLQACEDLAGPDANDHRLKARSFALAVQRGEKKPPT